MQAFISQKKKLESEVPKETGHFVGREARQEVAQELKRSHFILGSDQSDFRSKNQVAQQDQNWNIDQEERKNYDKFSKQIRQSNIQIGMNNKTSFQTTQNQDYDRKSVDQARVQAAIETKQDLRKAHFSFGSVSQGSESFMTTNMERFKKNVISEPSKTLQVHKPAINGPDKFKSTGNNVLAGGEKPNYQSSTKDSMVQHDLAESYKNLQQQQEQGKNLRKHHFQFGYGGENSIQSEYQGFQQDRAKSVPFQNTSFRNANDVKRSNIEIGNKWQGTDYTSMTKQTHQGAQQISNQPTLTTRSELQIDPTQAANNAKLDLRKSHFQVGTAPMVVESSAKSAFQSHNINNEIADQKTAIQNKMQRGNFRIGDEKNKGNQYETTYKQSIIPSDKIQEAMNRPDERKHLSGSINFGSHQGQYLSEAKSKFAGEAGEKDNQLKQMIEKNRNPHFKFGDGHTHEMTSVTKQQYDYKGSAADIRGYLDESKKADLKQHHFAMGSHSTEYQTSSLKINSDQPNPNSSNGFKFESKALLKNSGQRIFGGNSPQMNKIGAAGNGDYKTTNQSYIKWIQPAPTTINMSMGGPTAQIPRYKTMSKSSMQFLRADHQNQVTLSNNMQFLLKKLFITVLNEEKQIEQQRQKLAKTQDFDPCLAFHNFANKHSNCISSVDMHKYMRNYGIDEINEVDCEILSNYFSSRQDGMMDLQDFIQMILPCDSAKLRKKIDKKPKYLVSRNEPMTREVEAELTKLIELEISFNRKCEDLKQRIHSCKEFSEEKAFLSIDDWNYGYIDKTNLKYFLRKHGHIASTADILKIIRRMDLDGDARLSKQEFYEAIRPFTPFSKIMVRQEEEKLQQQHRRQKTPTFNCCEVSQSAPHRHDEIIHFTNNQVDTIRTMANDRKMRDRSGGKVSSSPLKRRPIIDSERIANGMPGNSAYRSRSSNINNSSMISRRGSQTPNKTPKKTTSNSKNINRGINQNEITPYAKQSIQIYRDEVKQIEDYGFKPTQQESDLLRELETKFLKNKNSSAKKHRFRPGNEFDGIKDQSIISEQVYNKNSLLIAISDVPQESYTQVMKNNSELKDSRINSSYQGDRSTIASSSPLRVKNLGSQYLNSRSDQKVASFSPFQQSANQENNDYYHSVRGKTQTGQNGSYYRHSESYFNISSISQNSYLDRIAIEELEQKQIVTRNLQELIFIDSQAEDLKIKLALKQDFTLIDAFGLLDVRGKGYLDPIELREQLYQLSHTRYTLDDMDLIFQKYNRQADRKMRYTDFTRAMMPIDQYYAKMQSLKRVQYHKKSMESLSNGQEDRDGSLMIFLRLWDQLILNERKAQLIKRDIYQRYRLNMRNLFQLIDSERDGYLTYSEVMHMFRECNQQLSINDFEYLRNRFDSDQDGKISFEEFECELQPKSSY